MALEKRGVIDPDKTPPEQKQAAQPAKSDKFDHPTKRAADQVSKASDKPTGTSGK